MPQELQLPYIYIYIYIERERERDRERDVFKELITSIGSTYVDNRESRETYPRLARGKLFGKVRSIEHQVGSPGDSKGTVIYYCYYYYYYY